MLAEAASSFGGLVGFWHPQIGVYQSPVLRVTGDSFSPSASLGTPESLFALSSVQASCNRCRTVLHPYGMLLSLARGRQQRLPATQLILAVALLVWTGIMLVLGTGQLVDRAPVTRATLEAIVAFASLFGALVMLLFPRGAASRRLWWVAAARPWMQLLICLPVGAAVGIAFILFSKPQRRVAFHLLDTLRELKRTVKNK